MGRALVTIWDHNSNTHPIDLTPVGVGKSDIAKPRILKPEPHTNLMPKLLPNPRVITLADVYRLLGRQTADDAIKHGWLKPCCLKDVPRGPQRRLYALADIHRVEDRLLSGEYPGQPKP